tara:strand:+ start:329 stop:535 length:207 start_codon:yes stop_codon:yes gene_type:complete
MMYSVAENFRIIIRSFFSLPSSATIAQIQAGINQTGWCDPPSGVLHTLNHKKTGHPPLKSAVLFIDMM